MIAEAAYVELPCRDHRLSAFRCPLKLELPAFPCFPSSPSSLDRSFATAFETETRAESAAAATEPDHRLAPLT
jgi:hypothetical protein